MGSFYPGESTEVYLGRPAAKSPKVGEGVRASPHEPVLLDCQAQITIGDQTFFGHGVKILTGMHDMNLRGKERLGSVLAKPVTIGNGVWVASYSIILGGVTIGDNAVIGAGSVVTHDIPANVLAAGNPCKVIRQL